MQFIEHGISNRKDLPREQLSGSFCFIAAVFSFLSLLRFYFHLGFLSSSMSSSEDVFLIKGM